MSNAMISRRGVALLLSGAYVLFSALATRGTLHFGGAPVVTMPVIRVIAYCFCAYFFFEIQRGKPNIFEKTIAYSSAGVFIAKLLFLICAEFHAFPSKLLNLLWIATVLLIIATVAMIARTIQMFREHQTSRRSVQG